MQNVHLDYKRWGKGALISQTYRGHFSQRPYSGRGRGCRATTDVPNLGNLPPSEDGPKWGENGEYLSAIRGGKWGRAGR